MFPYSGRASTITTVCDRHPDENDRYDYSCIVHDATWLKLDSEQNETLSEKHFNHYKLNFNTFGIFVVICTKVEQTEQPSRKLKFKFKFKFGVEPR
jgi:hypothetical protein